MHEFAGRSNQQEVSLVAIDYHMTTLMKQMVWMTANNYKICIAQSRYNPKNKGLQKAWNILTLVWRLLEGAINRLGDAFLLLQIKRMNVLVMLIDAKT